MISCISNKIFPFVLTLLLTFLTVFSSFAQGDEAITSKEGVTEGAPEAGGAAAVEAGGTLFKNNCAMCHAINEKVVGPALRDITKKHKQPWLINWIRNSSKMVQAGDEYAVKIFNEYDKQQMPSFAFSDEEIISILDYIDAESSAPVAQTAPTGGGANNQAATAVTDGPGGDSLNASRYLNIVLVALIVVLIVMVITLLIIANLMKDYLRGKKDLDGNDRELLEQRWDFSKVYKSRAVQVIVGLIFFCVLLDIAIEETYGIGLSQGYQPSQPIAFSHKLHAGEHQINCNYCHTSVYKSASANIPSANICMNCHSQIAKESQQIQKIYRAIENNRPIEWVRVHNLPDFTYFNHSQHTKVGGIECQTCHGPIETMDVVYQYSPLTMGWCINCHREQPLNTQGNAYYDNLVKIHDESNKGMAFTVSSNGGTECSKCHY